MYATERQRIIADLISTEGRVVVVDLAKQLDVTSETIRRDLDQLESAGVLRRVHGGALPVTRGGVPEASLHERSSAHLDAKKRIARAAFGLLSQTFSGTILLDGGTTTSLIAQLIAERDGMLSATPQTKRRQVTVVSNSIPVLSALAETPTVEVIGVGGRVRSLTSCTVGSVAREQFAGFRPDVAFVGTNGISAAFGLSTPDTDEADVKSQMLRSSRRVVLVSDSSKFGCEALVRFGGLADIDVLVTETMPVGPLADSLSQHNVEVVVA